MSSRFKDYLESTKDAKDSKLAKLSHMRDDNFVDGQARRVWWRGDRRNKRKVEVWARSTIFGWGHGADLHGCVDYRVCSTTSISRLSHGIAEISSLHFGDTLEAQRLQRGHAVHEIS